MIEKEIENSAKFVTDMIIELTKKPVEELTTLDCHILDLAYFLIRIQKEKYNENS